MIRHKVYTQSRTTGQILVTETYEIGDIASAQIEYKRQLNQYHEAIFAQQAIVYMCSTGVR